MMTRDLLFRGLQCKAKRTSADALPSVTTASGSPMLGHRGWAVWLASLLGLAWGPSPAVALGDLVVAPTRVVLEGRARSAEVALIHRGARPATYRLSFTQLRMREDGGMEEVAEPLADERFADQLLRFSPRQVTLEPGVTQTVRVQLRLPAELAAGEYRSHLVFRHLPDVDTAGETPAKAAPVGMAVELIPIYGVSIPVIIRHGDVGPATVTIRDLKLAQSVPGADALGGRPKLELTLERQGPRSVFGDLEVQAKVGGSWQQVGRINRLAVYTPNVRRRVIVELAAESLRAELLRVVYRDAEKAEGVVLAEASMTVEAR